MKETVIQLLAAFVGSFGFAMLFGLHRRYLLPASLGSVFVWGIFLAGQALLGTDFLPCLIASAFAVLYAELMARLLRTPATLFVIPAIFPLVPGSSLYYTMDCAVHGRLIQARAYGTQTLLYALAIAGGISLVIALRELNTKK